MQVDKKTEEQLQREEIFNKIKELSTPVEKVKAVAINHILDEKKKLDLQLEKEMKALTLKYDQLSQPLYAQTSEIINGRAIKSEEIEEVKQVLSEEEQKQLEAHQSNTESISEYWLKAMKNSEMTAPEIKEKDEEVLKHLINIVFTPNPEDPLKFELVFTFSENEFFENTTLTKSFVMRDDDEPVSGKGTEIQWKEGKDITVKIVKKTQKNKKSGAKRVVSKEVPDESFFNFFKDHEDNGEEEEQDDEEEAMEAELLSIDFDIARGLIDEVIPYSLEYFLGIKTPEDGYGDDMYDDEDEDLDDDEDEDDQPKKSKKKAHKKSSDSNKSGGDKKDGEKPECKQQ